MIKCCLHCDTQTHRHTDRDRETDRQTDRETDRPTPKPAVLLHSYKSSAKKPSQKTLTKNHYKKPSQQKPDVRVGSLLFKHNKLRNQIRCESGLQVSMASVFGGNPDLGPSNKKLKSESLISY